MSVDAVIFLRARAERRGIMSTPKLCTRLRILDASRDENGILVIRKVKFLDFSLVDDNHRFGFDAAGDFHLEGTAVPSGRAAEEEP